PSQLHSTPPTCIHSPLMSVVLVLVLLPLSILSMIPPLGGEDDLFLSSFSEITPHHNQIISPTHQNVVPAAIQTDESSIPELNSSGKKGSRPLQVFHNGPPGFMPPKAVSKMREELTKDLDDNHFGFVTRKGRARVLGISRRRPDFTRRQLI
ncbi:hypothetical protein PMAYCL1PPCAC_06922, partial [Pristionchus mayeri]